MKNLLRLLPVCALLVAASMASPADVQDDLAEQLKAELGVILVRNDTLQPVQIHQAQIGKHLLCFGADFKTFLLLEVNKGMFRSGQASVLVRCRDRQIYISKGYA